MRRITVLATFVLLVLVACSLAALVARDREVERDTSRVSIGPGRGKPASPATLHARRSRNADLVLIPAGTVEIGDNSGPPSERPAFHYTSTHFLMDRTPVTVVQFAAFVNETGYRTDSERYGYGGVLDERQGAWIAVKGATWRRPTGPRGPRAQGDHPVTQVSWFDANAFCRAYGVRLPTEFEWERAARMGQTPDGHVFRTGDSVTRGSRYLLNAWEGTFPLLDTGADGYRTTSPAGAFGTAPSGLTDMAGNVWEWTSSWYLPYGASQHAPVAGEGERVSRGGSFLCSPQFCQGYRASARNHATPDTSLENIGFRCASDPAHMTRFAGRVVRQTPNTALLNNRQWAQKGNAK